MCLECITSALRAQQGSRYLGEGSASPLLHVYRIAGAIVML
jgi:hypothetical protein